MTARAPLGVLFVLVAVAVQVLVIPDLVMARKDFSWYAALFMVVVTTSVLGIGLGIILRALRGRQ